ncbi:M14 family zinc carboxypeptidase [Actinoplanes sp. TFC3]|uniref:M14 family zinc carboxypeptidase n=1 Tax=Actinoplanes sp. TFC3 TaxID=1710355 RepID=UPI000834E00C|nr:M14 family zinc carboxypeptidase [Actinoplanes sp. TFC3]
MTDTSIATALPSWLLDELDTVPSYDHFAGVDELHAGLRDIAARYPDIATLRRCGSSQQGDPLLCLTVDRRPGERRGEVPEALAFGLPHPNEPIGGLTALHLAERLCADAGLRERLGHRWRIVDCADPDGLRLNEGWLRGPFTRAHYARHFYRPAGRDQVEWNFPINHGDAYFDEPMPETQALMRLIDEHRPALVASLHNSELGGAYYWLNRSEPELHPILKQIPQHLGIPLDRGEPEAAGLTLLDEAIYEATPLEKVYERTIADGEPWIEGGGSTTWYADRWGALMLVSELPYWLDPRASDTSAAGVTYASALAANADGLAGLATLLNDSVAAVEGKLLAPQSPYWRAGRFFARLVRDAAEGRRVRAAKPESDRPATVAEATSLESHVHEWRLRYGGILLRALQGEAAVGNVREPVRAALKDVEQRYAQWLEQDAANAELEPIEIRRLVGVQYAATIAAAAHLTARR